MVQHVGVSFPQPWPWLLFKGVRSVLPVAPTLVPKAYRGPVLLHAAEASHDDFDATVREMVAGAWLPSGMRPPWRADLPAGGFVARAVVLGAVSVGSGVGLQLAEVEPLPVFVPGPAPTLAGLCFEVSDALFATALARAQAARTAAELAAVAQVWRAAPAARRPTRRASTSTAAARA